jgi:5-methylcytosine-specific restriction endonuclease McrA
MNRKNVYSDPVYRHNRKIILDASQHTCHYCNAYAITADHIIPVSHGGTHELSNLLPACKSCNSTRKNKTLVRMKYWNKKYV